MKNSNMKFLAALLAGAAAGATLAVLFAPSKGTDSRKKIADEVDDIIDSFTEKKKEFVNRVANMNTKSATKV